jgi:hypothetical protein
MERFDIVIVGDFRFRAALPGGRPRVAGAAVDQPCRRAVNSAYLGPKLVGWHQAIVAEVDRGGLHVLPEEAAAEAHVIFVHSPWILPRISRTRLRAPIRILVAHHPPVDARGRLYYDPRAIERQHIRRWTGRVLALHFRR